MDADERADYNAKLAAQSALQWGACGMRTVTVEHDYLKAIVSERDALRAEVERLRARPTPAYERIAAATVIPSVNADPPTDECRRRGAEWLMRTEAMGLVVQEVVQHPDGGIALHFKQNGNRYGYVNLYNDGGGTLLCGNYTSDGAPMCRDLRSGDLVADLYAHLTAPTRAAAPPASDSFTVHKILDGLSGDTTGADTVYLTAKRAETARSALAEPVSPDDELLPCPFCGDDSVSESKDQTSVFCQNCGARGPIFISEGDHELMWNRRASTPAPSIHAAIENMDPVINCNGLENASNTPDFILANFLRSSLSAFNAAVNRRAKWYGRDDAPGRARPAVPPGQGELTKCYHESRTRYVGCGGRSYWICDGCEQVVGRGEKEPPTPAPCGEETHYFCEDENGNCTTCGEGISHERHNMGINWMDRFNRNKAESEAELRYEAAVKLAKASAHLRSAMLSSASRHPMSSELIVCGEYLAWTEALDAFEPMVASGSPNREHEQNMADDEVRLCGEVCKAARDIADWCCEPHSTIQRSITKFNETSGFTYQSYLRDGLVDAFRSAVRQAREGEGEKPDEAERVVLGMAHAYESESTITLNYKGLTERIRAAIARAREAGK